jgi:hypothetical protein
MIIQEDQAILDSFISLSEFNPIIQRL